MAKVKNANVATPVVETVPAVETPVAKRTASVSDEKFREFIFSPAAREMTAAEGAKSLGMELLTFRQRLTSLRRDQKTAIKWLNEHGMTDKVDQVPAIPAMKDGRHGRTGKKQELNKTQRALLSFLQAE